MFSYGNNLYDAQTQRLFTSIDTQLERWSKKYGPRPQSETSQAPPHVEANATVSATGTAASVHSKMNAEDVGQRKDIMVPGTTDSGSSSSSSTSGSGGEDELASSALLSRIVFLEKQLLVVDEDRMELRERLKSTERQLSDLLFSYDTLQSQFAAFREQILPSSQGANEDEEAIGAAVVGENSNFTTRSLASRRSSSANFSGPPTVTSTEASASSRIASGVRGAFLGGESPNTFQAAQIPVEVTSAQRRKMVLEHLAKRLVFPPES
ncbi:hypothetical protein DQ04_03171010 [Trypanosoma grayi]|uniref:hypothetical protein n=1 Tax=Trypanosoma grayi TaxID=71804 RepID=UPI0004F4BC33|nr:hypothetical protein DQ04_03171010 [Trypanosoma grayi]KEG10897.1 hypothetical protein DQ04_03171010 [Trypanosoma grayi]